MRYLHFFCFFCRRVKIEGMLICRRIGRQDFAAQQTGAFAAIPGITSCAMSRGCQKAYISHTSSRYGQTHTQRVEKVALPLFRAFPSLYCTLAAPSCGRLLGQGRNFFEIPAKITAMSLIFDLPLEDCGPPIPPIRFSGGLCMGKPIPRVATKREAGEVSENVITNSASPATNGEYSTAHAIMLQ